MMPVSGPRLLLRRLREVMAGSGSAEERLHAVVRIIANNMVAEVCSVYLLRAGDVLELFATEGLNPEAVHLTKLRVGEGLVGDIAAHARPLNLSDAQAHPNFAYRPETGEEIYHSLLGVPILRGGRVAGVLVVQNRTRRHYSEEEAEAMQTVAMVLAELIGSGQLVDPSELFEAAGNVTLPNRVEGHILAEGLAEGYAVLHEPRIVVEKAMADDILAEKTRLERAVTSLRDSVDRMLDGPGDAIGGESREILEAYKMFANDRGWLSRMHEAVGSGLTAEAAIKRVQDETRARMADVSDPYLRERLADLDDLANRLFIHLNSSGLAYENLPEDAIIVARSMGAAELLDYDRSNLRGVVLEEGAPTSHVAIVARALGIPVVGRCESVRDKVEPGDRIVVDGEHGQVFIRPGEEVLQAYQQNMALRVERKAKYAALRDVDSVTRDGTRITLNMNAGLLVDVDHFLETGADGIGLYRTELQFMVRSTLPKIDAQTELYAKVLEKAGEHPVTFRTLDVGGDKVLPYLRVEREENPALGWRAIRIALDRPGLLRSQLRALLRASPGREIRLMFPMIAEVGEFLAAKAILDREIARLEKEGKALPQKVQVGAMLEVPALLWQLPALLAHVDFLSIGSNDLMQFFFAVDRGNPKLAGRYDLLSPAVLSMLKGVVQACDAANIPIALCGEMAGRPLEAMALIGIGFRSMSMSAESLGPVKEMILSLNTAALTSYLDELLQLPDHSLRGHLESFARDHGTVI